MREIKFRAVDKFNKKIIGWDEVKALIRVVDFDIIKRDYPLLQYTGLKDVNGIEIYEGDILSVIHQDSIDEPTNHIVEWGGDKYPAFDLEPSLGCDCNSFSEIRCSGCYEIKIIGNIYQNPELLEVKHA